MNKIKLIIVFLLTTITSAQFNHSLGLNNMDKKIFQLKINYKKTINNYDLNFGNIIKNENKSIHKYSSSNVFGQVVIGSLSAVVFSAPAAFGFSYGGGNHPSDGGKLFLTYSLYTLGAAVGVYWIGSKENDSLSFWETFASSVIGGGVGVLTYYQIKNRFYFPILAGPIVGSLIYSLFISD